VKNYLVWSYCHSHLLHDHEELRLFNLKQRFRGALIHQIDKSVEFSLDLFTALLLRSSYDFQDSVQFFP
jgi:hypothetical protein